MMDLQCMARKFLDIPIFEAQGWKFRASGPSIVDTGFDGGVYPNMEIIKMFRGLEPKAMVVFENPCSAPPILKCIRRGLG